MSNGPVEGGEERTTPGRTTGQGARAARPWLARPGSCYGRPVPNPGEAIVIGFLTFVILSAPLWPRAGEWVAVRLAGRGRPRD